MNPLLKKLRDVMCDNKVMKRLPVTRPVFPIHRSVNYSFGSGHTFDVMIAHLSQDLRF